MKKSILLLSVALLGIIAGNAQTIRASLQPGSNSSSVRIYVQLSAAVPQTNISTIQFNLALPESVTPAPTLSWTPNPAVMPSSAVWELDRNVDQGYINYPIIMITSPIIINTFNTTDPILIGEATFNGGPVGNHEVRLLTLPGGGTIENLEVNNLFFVSGTPESVGTNLYFTMPGVTVFQEGDAYFGNGIAWAALGNISLPVKFLSFYAVKSQSGASLTWSVENDIRNKEFVVERSANGRDFEAIATVPAKGNGSHLNSYDLLDDNLNTFSNNNWYYRILQRDVDGTLTYSEVRNLNFGLNTAAQLFPNPAKTSTRLVFNSPVAEKATVMIRDMNGKLMSQYDMRLIAGVNQQVINVNTFAAGEYAVTLITESNVVHTMKLTKAK